MYKDNMDGLLVTNYFTLVATLELAGKLRDIVRKEKKKKSECPYISGGAPFTKT